MARCCDPRGCDDFFDPRFAGRVAKRYRERGLDRTRQRMVDFLAEQGLQGATVLEIGGGIGEIQVELLKRGAARAVNLELSPAYDAEANALLQESGLADRAERRIHDIAVDPEGVEPVDVVVLHRVVCCYPDYERLLTAAASRARRLVVLSFPRRNLVSRAFIALQNAGLRITRNVLAIIASLAPLRASAAVPVTDALRCRGPSSRDRSASSRACSSAPTGTTRSRR